LAEEKELDKESEREAREREGEEEENRRVVRSYPSNKYELAIVAAREARRLNEAWRDTEERRTGRVTAKALERVRKGLVRYRIPEDEGS